MKVSVITTVYNGIEHLDSTVMSISKQDFDDFEHIVVNDGSTDGTVQYLEKLNYPHLRIVNLKRCGRGVALNEGIKISKGKYIAILDADDVSSKVRLRIQAGYLDNHPECSVLASDYTVQENHYLDRNPGEIQSIKLHHADFIRRNAVCHSSAMIRRSALDEVNGYSEDRTELFDYDLWVKLLINESVFEKINACLIYKRIHRKQNFEKRKRFKYLWGSLIFKLRLLERFGGTFADYLYPIIAFAYGLLPVVIRKKFMEH